MQSQPRKQGPLIVSHFETHLGPMMGGWERGADGKKVPFTVVRFDSTPFKGCSAFATIGLSKYPLHSSTSTNVIRQELFMIVRDSTTLGIPSLLQTIGCHLIDDCKALLRGEVVGPRGPLWNGSKLEAVYATIPTYLPDEFAACDLEDGSRCAIAWLIPVTRKESAFIRSHGWDAFEAILVQEDPDLLAPNRDDMARICGDEPLHSTG